MKSVNGHEIIQTFESWSPKKLACMENDPIGLAIGTLNKSVSNVLVTLDVTEAVVDEAIEKNCQLIIAHHPPIFRKLSNMRTDTPQGRLIEKCIKHDIAVYAAHTNLDVVEGGVNDLLADALQLENRQLLEQTSSESLMKLAVFVPTHYASQMHEALAAVGAGQLGSYDSCSFTTDGTGRFKPLEGAQPTIGQLNRLEEVAEQKIEVVFPTSLKNKVLKVMYTTHPYEEPAFDLWTLNVETNVQGIGRIGTLPEEMTLEQFAHFVKQQLDVPALRVVGPLDKPIRKVAVLGGDGNKYVFTAKFAGADVLVTGDIGFHIAQDAEVNGLSIVDPGHHVEKVMIQGVAKKMTALCAQRKLHVKFIESNVHTEPFKFI